MSRLILTFPTLFQVLAADKNLRGQISCRATPTPQGLSADICGISLELLKPEELDRALTILAEKSLQPRGVHQV